MALQNAKIYAVFKQMSMDHNAHAASLLRALATGVSESLKSRTKKDAIMGSMRLQSDKFGIVVHHESDPNQPEHEQRIVQSAHEKVVQNLGSKDGILMTLSQQGVK